MSEEPSREVEIPKAFFEDVPKVVDAVMSYKDLDKGTKETIDRE